ncbi:4-(cytidine 5'-diphospho)-2-C-methyl-D-erythritol kinase [Afifella sp. IM 167]|uniref:4-(cytidine 5'-diphospho)-2-C-methyl-D-erythritol kinase n=1 Tax=Afifella sp. IM 167 TaxID=2033586 RepID=UPI001CCCFD63|nr:4-(cytidine 5'-diphospho)-2-C-methyl-D-erythritol kinase [Afifella sp. IM 167]MBZ8133379.1 4-(cytidine 5'-diphospho)-2-C-methyl-D-erythritol kinase [Afifella sp. IM 167]
MRPPDEAIARTAFAKVNLALHVTGRRPDGYHLLDTLAVFADIGDDLRFVSAEALSLEVTGIFSAEVPRGPDNLILRAAEALAAECPDRRRRGAAIFVRKELPAGAGLGGGSADAAATLLALCELWECDCRTERLVELATKLGADVPMALFSKGLRAGGIGEDIRVLPDMPPLPMVLAWPARPVSTARVFSALASHDGAGLPEMPEGLADVAAVADYLAATDNHLQGAAMEIEPAIEEAIRLLEETPALMARMSGSGSACFALYRDEQAADAAAEALREERPNWWVRAAVAS